MDVFQKDDSAEADRKVDECLDESDGASLDDSDAKFLVRVDEYRLESLDRVDHRAACLGKINADLMAMLHHSGKAINRAFDTDKSVLEMPHVGRALKMHLSLGHQLNHLENLEARFEELKLAQYAGSSRRVGPLRGPNIRPR
jgi:hypothetical protein